MCVWKGEDTLTVALPLSLGSSLKPNMIGV